MFEPVTFQPNIQPVLLPCAKATKARRSGSDMSLKTKNSQKKTIFKLSRNSKTASVKRKQPKKVKKQARIKANSAGSESKSRTKPKQMRRATRRAKGRMVGLANRRSGRHTRYKKTLSPHHTCTPSSCHLLSSLLEEQGLVSGWGKLEHEVGQERVGFSSSSGLQSRQHSDGC